jgi:hypothetical protein
MITLTGGTAPFQWSVYDGPIITRYEVFLGRLAAGPQPGIRKDGILSVSNDPEIDPDGAQADGQFVSQSGHGCQYATEARLRGGMSLL